MCRPTVRARTAGPGAPGRARSADRPSRQELGGLALGGDAHDVPRQAGLLERPDDPRGGVELPAPETVAGRGGEGVMAVVPGLPEGEDREPREVARLVGGVVLALAEEVAERID